MKENQGNIYCPQKKKIHLYQLKKGKIKKTFQASKPPLFHENAAWATAGKINSTFVFLWIAGEEEIRYIFWKSQKIYKGTLYKGTLGTHTYSNIAFSGTKLLLLYYAFIEKIVAYSQMALQLNQRSH
jgi:hypothetical protein